VPRGSSASAGSRPRGGTSGGTASIPNLLTAVIHFTAATLLLWRPDFVRVASAGIIAATLAVNGLTNVLGASVGRPRSHWIGKLVAGLLMLASAAVVALQWPMSGQRVLGDAVGLSLLAGGISTITLGWMTRAHAARH